MKEKARLFAINAHKGQVRKNDPEKPMIIHPLSVGNLLEEYGYDDNVIAAGYLHDTVEDTECTLEIIKQEFNEDIADLVDTASEPDKSLSWEARKKHTIELTKNLPIRNKVLICADKINNLEDLMLKFRKTGKRDFSGFKRGEEQQKWYYESIYNSLIENEDESLPIFARLKEVIEIVYEDKKDLFLEEIYSSNIELYNKLVSLDALKKELKRIKDLIEIDKPFVVEFCGTPRTGKTTILNNIYDFFKKGNFKIKLIEELTTSKYYKEIFFSEIKNMGIANLNIEIIKEARKQLLATLGEDLDIILIDRSINDRLIWNYRRFKKGDISKEIYEKIKEEFKEFSKANIDLLIINYTDEYTALKRDYNNSLSLEKRKFLNLENIKEYNDSLEEIEAVFNESVDNLLKVDTTNISPLDSSIIITEKILKTLEKKYIKTLNEKYK